MPATPRPRGYTGASASSSRPSTNTPMSERQQLALLLQMTSSSNQSDMTGHSPARSRDRNERGETALHVAAIKGEQDAVKKLLDQGMNPNVVDFAGWSPLHEACNHGHYHVALTLIKAGANVNAKGLDDNTPLHDAAYVGHLKLVKMLIEKGADPSIKNRKGKTACDVAVAPVYSFLQQSKESSNNRTSQQIKKGGGGGGGGNAVGGGGSNTDAKTKSSIDDNEDATCNSASSGGGSNSANQSSGGGGNGSAGGNQNLNTSNVNVKEDDDIYEFKTTPKDLISGDDKTDSLLSGNSNNSNSGANVQINTSGGGNSSNSTAPNSSITSGTSLNIKNLDKIISDDKTGSDDLSGGSSNLLGGNTANQSKRPHSDIENTEETTFNTTDDENKRKKRKESEAVKESTKTASGGRGIQTARQDKNSKILGTAAKAIGLAGKSGQIDRKSPCASPKPASKSTDSDAEIEVDNKSESFGSSGGPKVPPLKIVIPPQNTTGDQDACIRNGKNTSARNHPALPYVVASSSSSSSNDLNVEKESSSSRCTSPTEPVTKSNDNEKQTKLGAISSAEERAQQRVLRSSHRSGGASGQSVDRGSNNSSPQLQSSSPSPAPAPATGITSTVNQSTAGTSTTTTTSTTTSETANLNSAQQSSSSNTSSPIAQPQNNPDSDTTVRNAPSPVAPSITPSAAPVTQNTVELHPRKRKIRTSKEDTKSSQAQSNTSTTSSSNESEKESILKDEVPSHDQPMTNCYQMYLNIRKQIERRQKNLIPVQPKPPQGFKDYLMNRGTYVLSGKTSEPALNYPSNLAQPMKELYSVQEKERHKLKMQHVVEKEKLVLAVEQEILRVHGRAARALANQSLPFSVCTILKDEEVYNMITPEQEEKDRNARSRYNGRLFLSWLQDVDDKWEKIKEAMLFRHHNEVESLHAVQKMDWEWKMKELLLCEYKAKPVIDELHVPIVHVSDDFDLLPA